MNIHNSIRNIVNEIGFSDELLYLPLLNNFDMYVSKDIYFRLEFLL